MILGFLVFLPVAFDGRDFESVTKGLMAVLVAVSIASLACYATGTQRIGSLDLAFIGHDLTP